MTAEYLVLILIAIIITACFVLTSVILIKAVNTMAGYIAKMQMIKEKDFLFNLDLSDENNFKMLDSLIEDSITRYRIMYLEYHDEMYISDDDQKAMINWLMKDILGNISPVYYDKLRYIYNKNKLEDIIYNKVSLAVLSYTISINGNMKEQKR